MQPQNAGLVGFLEVYITSVHKLYLLQRITILCNKVRGGVMCYTVDPPINKKKKRGGGADLFHLLNVSKHFQRTFIKK